MASNKTTRSALCVASFAVVTLLAASALAQIRPKIYILFDTSGSMLQNSAGQFQSGDGSVLCQARGQSSRIYQLKAAFFDVLQGNRQSVVAFEWRITGKHVISRYAKRINIGSCIERLTFYLFRTHI